jgi:soluble lytic murein transglycosylase-like protein
LLWPGVIPSVFDVRGGPIPGLRPALPAHRTGGPGFQELLRDARAAVPAAAVPRPSLLPAPRALAAEPVRRTPSLPAPPASLASRGRAAIRLDADAKQALAATIRRSATSAGVEPALSVAVARAESSLDPGARSPDGKSVGTFQVTATTAAEMRRRIAAGRVPRPAGGDDVALGVGYLRYLDDLFARRAVLARGLATTPVADGDERRRFAVAAYNAGEGRVARAQAAAAAAGGDPTRFDDVRRYLPGGTRTYVDRVLAFRTEEAAAAVG